MPLALNKCASRVYSTRRVHIRVYALQVCVCVCADQRPEQAKGMFRAELRGLFILRLRPDRSCTVLPLHLRAAVYSTLE